MRKVFASIIFCYAFVMVVDVKAYDSRRLGGTAFPSRRKSASVVSLIDARASIVPEDNGPSTDDEDFVDDSWRKRWEEDDPSKAKFDKFKVRVKLYPEQHDVFYGTIIGVASPVQMQEIDKDAPSKYETTYYMVKTAAGTPKVVREDKISGYKPSVSSNDNFKLCKDRYLGKTYCCVSREEKLNLPIFVKMKSGWKRLVNVDKDLKSKYARDEKRRLEAIAKINSDKKEREQEAEERAKREKQEAEEQAKRDRERPIREEYDKLKQNYEIALYSAVKSDPQRRCMIHKWQEKFAPRYKGDLYTEQSKSNYARNYIEALRAQKEGVLKCECRNPIYVELNTKALADCDEAKKKLDDFRAAHEDIDFGEN